MRTKLVGPALMCAAMLVGLAVVAYRIVGAALRWISGVPAHPSDGYVLAGAMLAAVAVFAVALVTPRRRG